MSKLFVKEPDKILIEQGCEINMKLFSHYVIMKIFKMQNYNVFTHINSGFLSDKSHILDTYTRQNLAEFHHHLGQNLRCNHREMPC